MIVVYSILAGLGWGVLCGLIGAVATKKMASGDQRKIASLSMLIFSDRSMQQLEYQRGLGKPGRNKPALLRTPLCAAFATAAMSTILSVGLQGVSR